MEMLFAKANYFLCDLEYLVFLWRNTAPYFAETRQKSVKDEEIF